MKKTIIGFAIGFVFSVNINAQKSKEIITYDVPMESFPHTMCLWNLFRPLM